MSEKILSARCMLAIALDDRRKENIAKSGIAAAAQFASKGHQKEASGVNASLMSMSNLRHGRFATECIPWIKAA